MKALVAVMVYPWGVEARGYSYDYYNIYLPMCDLAETTILFDFYGEYQRHGQAGMNRRFRDLVSAERPDVVLVVPTRDEFLPATISAVGAQCPILAYFHDDVWRVDYARHWAQYYTYVIGTDPDVEAKFQAAGFSNAIYSPRGYNPHIYRPNPGIEQDIDVSFVGGYAPYRQWIVSRLRRAGIDVRVFGSGWHNATALKAVEWKAKGILAARGIPVRPVRDGHISQERMVEVFWRSKINLNLSNSKCWDARYLVSSPISVYNAVMSKKSREQIKGRHFEINGCGGFQLSYYVKGLEDCYTIGRELAVFSSDVDMIIDSVSFYLDNHQTRLAISTNGLARSQRDHVISSRFGDLLQRIGLHVTIPVGVGRALGPR